MSGPTTSRSTGPHPLRGRVRVPGDKGMSHRVLLFAAMADGPSRVTGLAGGDDVRRTRRALGQLGVTTTSDIGTSDIGTHRRGDRRRPRRRGVHRTGRRRRLRQLGHDHPPPGGLLAGRPFLSVLTGDESLVQRPMRRVIEPLRAMGAHVDGRDGGTCPPLVVRGGDLVGTAHQLAVASAQVKTALILAGLQAGGTTEVTEPRRSRDHTERMLAALGAPVTRGRRASRARHRRRRRGPFDFEVPGDPSSAAFWVVGATITPGSELVVEDVALNPTRHRVRRRARAHGRVDRDRHDR